MVALPVNQRDLNTDVSQDLLDLAAKWLTLYVLHDHAALPVT